MPTFTTPNLLPFQREGVKQIISQKSTLLADEMGLGKTIQAICSINHLKNLSKILIVCPASVKVHWAEKLDIWLTKFYDVYTVYGRHTLTLEILKKSEILIINYDLVDDYVDILNKVRWDLKIVDECQYLGGRDSQRTNATLSIWAARNIFMSGTPGERPVEMYPMLRHLSPDIWPRDEWEFYRRYCDPKYITDSNTGRGKWDLRGAENLNEIRRKLYSSIMIRRTKEDVLKELEPKIRKIRYCPDVDGYLEKEKKGIDIPYEEAVEQMCTWGVDFGEHIATTKRELGVSKIPMIIKTLEELMHRHRKVVCYVYHTIVGMALAGYFTDKYKGAHPNKAVLINGMAPLKIRERSKYKFKNDPNCQLYIGAIPAMGTGTDGLQEIANVGLVAELDWSFKNMIQAEDRIHRFGQKDTAEYIYLVVRGSLEEYIVEKLQGKKRNYNAMFDKPRKMA
jgi:SWI/SNF-related matrix-associated actin-dependent regulator 1 of chromatin subfamily A